MSVTLHQRIELAIETSMTGPRTELKKILTELVGKLTTTTDSDEILSVYAIGDRLSQLGEAITSTLKESAKEAVGELLGENEKTLEYAGEKFTLSESKVYEYPADKLLSVLDGKKKALAEKIEPLTVDMKSIDASIKERKKQLEVNLEPVAYEYTLKVAKA